MDADHYCYRGQKEEERIIAQSARLDKGADRGTLETKKGGSLCVCFKCCTSLESETFESGDGDWNGATLIKVRALRSQPHNPSRKASPVAWLSLRGRPESSLGKFENQVVGAQIEHRMPKGENHNHLALCIGSKFDPICQTRRQSVCSPTELPPLFCSQEVETDQHLHFFTAKNNNVLD
ncbi:hypothetical protein L7F22_005968 [Adiantum nelumboides]|nr:hypothetical protein [Adiantum nelumboides]